jgi:hypothetical protein
MRALRLVGRALLALAHAAGEMAEAVVKDNQES